MKIVSMLMAAFLLSASAVTALAEETAKRAKVLPNPQFRYFGKLG